MLAASASLLLAACFSGAASRRARSLSRCALRSAHGGRRLSRARAAAGLLRLLRPHVGALLHVGVARALPRREPRGAWRRQLPGPQCARGHLRGHGPGRRLGCYAGGSLADRWGRTTLTMAAMALSGLCAATIGLTFGGPPALTFALALFWGVTVIADSAQFSTAVTELCPPAYVGTALTAQTCVGFALTIISIWLIPPVVRLVGLAVGLRPARPRPRPGRAGHGPPARRARGRAHGRRPPLAVLVKARGRV